MTEKEKGLMKIYKPYMWKLQAWYNRKNTKKEIEITEAGYAFSQDKKAWPMFKDFDDERAFAIFMAGVEVGKKENK
jgi:hypothetical protein